ncbi:hypothetical protein JW979_10750 [bacterium]|nr:hypothetical protein [candidate division CSSED10-310 bacterium]
MVQWIGTHETLLWWLASSSMVVFIATLIVVPLLVVRIPSDYFLHARHQRPVIIIRNQMTRLVLKIGRNVLGFVFVIAGFILLLLPGQGILTILAGIMLMNFPGKDRLVLWIVSRGPVLRSINWLRRRARKESLTLNTK